MYYPPENHCVLQLSKRNLRLIFFTSICAAVQVLVSVSITQEVFVCVCVCLSVIISLCSWVIFVYIGVVYWFYGCSFFMLNWMFQHDCLDTYCF